MVTLRLQNYLFFIPWPLPPIITTTFFAIERSTDVANRETITYVQGSGNSNQVITYSWKDLQPLNGISYYRLKQTDFDWQFEHFAPVAVNFNNSDTRTEILQVSSFGQQLNVW